MPRASRAQRFLIEPLAVTRDPAFEAMSHEARGIYLTVLLEAWFERDAGRILYSAEKLARMGQCTAEKWLDLVHEIEPAFHVEIEGRDGASDTNAPSRCDMSGTVTRTWWTLPLMSGAYLSQSAKRDMDAKRKRRNRKQKRDGASAPNAPSSGGSGSGSGSVCRT